MWEFGGEVLRLGKVFEVVVVGALDRRNLGMRRVLVIGMMLGVGESRGRVGLLGGGLHQLVGMIPGFDQHHHQHHHHHQERHRHHHH